MNYYTAKLFIGIFVRFNPFVILDDSILLRIRDGSTEVYALLWKSEGFSE